jgi:hypothetical protein
MMNSISPERPRVPPPDREIERNALIRSMLEAVGITVNDVRAISAEVLGDGMVTGHEVDIEHEDGMRTHVLYVDNETRNREPREDVTRERLPSGEWVDIWVYPADPALPALATAVFPETAAVILARIGRESAGATVAVRAYRPGKRAVLEVRAGTRSTFLKVVPPSRVQRIAERHQQWRDHGIPVPRVLTWSSEGLLALEQAPGTAANTVVDDLGDDFLDAVAELRRRVGGIPSSEPARSSPLTRVGWYERTLAGLAPELAERAGALGRRVSALRDAVGDNPRPQTIHGDLHPSQLFLDLENPRHILGVLDIDTAGWGDPADDEAALWAHLVTTAAYREVTGWPTSGCRRLAASARGRWHRHDDPHYAERTAAIAAVQLMGHAFARFVPPADLIGVAESLLSDYEGALIAS